MHISVGPVRGGGEQTITPIPGEPVLFLDDASIARAEAIERVWHFPEKHPEPVMKADKPWEVCERSRCVGGFSGKSIVAKDGKLMMFYSVYHMGDHGEFRSFAYAESKDGLKWTKPDLGDGTNLLVKNKLDPKRRGPALPYWELQNVLYDDHAKCWRAMGHCAPSKGKSGTFYATSDSPTKWDKKAFRFAYKNADIHALLGWDSLASVYVSYPRVDVWHDGKRRRAIGFSSSKDFKKWTDPVLCHAPTFLDRAYEIYNMPVERVGQYYVAFPIGYRPSHGGSGPLDSELAISANGADFGQPLGHVPYIGRGLPGEWDDSYVMTAAPVNFKGQTLFYYWGCNFPHDTGYKQEKVWAGSVGLASMPQDRYCGLACSRLLPGFIETGWIKRMGASQLTVNADASRGRIEVIKLDVAGKPESLGVLKAIDCVDCKISMPKDELFDLRFEISDAELFGVTFT